MEKRIYFAVINGSLIDNYEIARMALVVSGKYIRHDDFESIREYAAYCNGIKKELSNPSVKYLVRHGFKVQAIKIYYDRHPELGLRGSKEVIDKIEEEIKQSENWFNICIRMKFPF